MCICKQNKAKGLNTMDANTYKGFRLLGEINMRTGGVTKTDAMKHFSQVFYGWTNNENDPNGIVTIPNEETVTVSKPLIVGQYFEDGFPYLDYLAQGDCFTGEQYLTQEEADALNAQHGQEKAAIMWLKQKGFDSLVCWHYDGEPGENLHFIFVL